MDRLEQIMSELEDFIGDRFERNIDEMHSYFEENYEKETNDFASHLKDIYLLAINQQKSEKKAGIKYLHIAFLRSSLLTESYNLKLSLYSEKFYMDKTETSIYWKPGFIFKYIDGDMAEAKELLIKKSAITQISEFDLKELRYAYAQMYLPVCLPFIGDLVEGAMEIIVQDEWEVPVMTDDFSVIYGGHMEKGYTVYPITENNPADVEDVEEIEEVQEREQ